MKPVKQSIVNTCQSETEGLKTALGASAVEVEVTTTGFVVTVMGKDSQLDKLLLQPNETSGPAGTRRTATGTVNVRGYTRKNRKPSLNELIEANEADERLSGTVSTGVSKWVYAQIQAATANLSSVKL